VLHSHIESLSDWALVLQLETRHGIAAIVEGDMTLTHLLQFEGKSSGISSVEEGLA